MAKYHGQTDSQEQTLAYNWSIRNCLSAGNQGEQGKYHSSNQFKCSWIACISLLKLMRRLDGKLLFEHQRNIRHHMPDILDDYHKGNGN